MKITDQEKEPRGEKERRINDLLCRAGVRAPQRTSRCLRAGLAKGLYDFTGKPDDLDKVVTMKG